MFGKTTYKSQAFPQAIPQARMQILKKKLPSIYKTCSTNRALMNKHVFILCFNDFVCDIS